MRRGLKAPVTAVRECPAVRGDRHERESKTELYDTVVVVARHLLDKSCQLGHCPMARHSISSLAPTSTHGHLHLNCTLRSRNSRSRKYFDLCLI